MAEKSTSRTCRGKTTQLKTSKRDRNHITLTERLYSCDIIQPQQMNSPKSNSNKKPRSPKKAKQHMTSSSPSDFQMTGTVVAETTAAANVKPSAQQNNNNNNMVIEKAVAKQLFGSAVKKRKRHHKKTDRSATGTFGHQAPLS